MAESGLNPDSPVPTELTATMSYSLKSGTPEAMEGFVWFVFG